MKSKLITISILVALIACSNNDKQAQLVKLKTKRDKLNEKIQNLEQELAASKDSTGVKKYISVTVEEIRPKSFNHFIEVYGKLDGEENIGVYPKMSGTVLQKYADVGQQVKKDQILAQLDDAIYQQQLSDLRINLSLVKDLYEKQKALWEQKIGSEVQYMQAKTNLESLQKKEKLLLEQIDMMKITSPIDGTIEESNIKTGQIATPLPTQPVFRVVNFNKVKVSADISEGYSNIIKKGNKVTISFPDINQEIETNINFVSRYINPVNRTFQVEINLPKTPDGIKANMIALIRINDYSNPNAIVLPVNLIQTEDKGDFVLIAVKEKDGFVARKKYIQKGQIYNGKAEIIDGLVTGDKVITSGFFNLEDGSFIKL